MLNDALSIYPEDATVASAFMARWHVGAEVDTAGGVTKCARVIRSVLGSAQQDAVRRSEFGRARLESVFARPDRNRRDAVMPAKLHRAGDADTDLDPDSAQEQKTEGIVEQNIAIIARYSISAVIPLLALPKFVDRRKNSIDLPLIR